MNDKFTVEEVNLICIFECKSRTKVISDIKKAIKHLDDGEMVELSNPAYVSPIPLLPYLQT